MRNIKSACSMRLTLLGFALCLFFCGGWGLLSSNSVAVAAVTDEPLSVVLQSISAAAAQVTTISSRMEQEKHLKAFNEVLKASGQFVFKQPDCWRWELTEPVASGLSVCGDHGQRWHEKGAIVQSFKLDNEPWLKHFATQVTAWTTADFDLLQKYYIITLLEQNPPTLKLVPKESAARRLISALEITFSGDYSYVVEIIIHESDRDYTAIKFLDVVVNDPLVKDYFE